MKLADRKHFIAVLVREYMKQLPKWKEVEATSNQMVLIYVSCVLIKDATQRERMEKLDINLAKYRTYFYRGTSEHWQKKRKKGGRKSESNRPF